MSQNHPCYANHKNRSKDYVRAKELRQHAVRAEQILWGELRSGLKSLNVRFRRQHPVNPYIVDFICLKFKLIIEIDGPSHDLRVDYDRKRTTYLNKLGYEVMRFSNKDVLCHCSSVIETIYNRLVQYMRDEPRP